MASDHEAKVTTEHGEIKRWVEARGGHPARVKGTEILRIDYPGFEGEETLEQISWEEFLNAFDLNGLAFLYQEQTASGETSRFSKLISRETAEGKDQNKAAGA